MWTPEADWKRQGQCWICKVSFSKIRGISQHHCRACGNSVCNKHSENRLNKPDDPEPVRVCDNCIERSIIEEKRKEYQEELRVEASKLTKLANSNEELIDVLNSKQAKLYALEDELLELQRSSEDELGRLRAELKAELLSSEKNEKLIDTLRKNIDLSHEHERRLEEEGRNAEKEARELTREINELKTNKSDILEQVEILEERLEGSVSYAEVKDIICQECQRKLNVQAADDMF